MVRAKARTIPTPETPGGAAKFLAEASGLSELDVTRTASLIMVDSYIDEGGVLQIRTGLPEDNFRLVSAALLNSMDADLNSPLYWGKKGAESSAGRRCSVAPRHMLFLYFEHKRHGMSQDYVASVYKISQTAISRYFEYIEQWMSNLLPTADRISEELQNARTEDQIQRVFNKLLRRLEKSPASSWAPRATRARRCLATSRSPTAWNCACSARPTRTRGTRAIRARKKTPRAKATRSPMPRGRCWATATWRRAAPTT